MAALKNEFRPEASMKCIVLKRDYPRFEVLEGPAFQLDFA